MIRVDTWMSGLLELKLSQKDFDRSRAKGDADWSVPKLIKPNKLFYTGTIDEIEYD